MALTPDERRAKFELWRSDEEAWAKKYRRAAKFQPVPPDSKGLASERPSDFPPEMTSEYMAELEAEG